MFLSTVAASRPAPSATTPPAITGVPATETDPGQASFMPLATAVVTGTETGQTYTVSLEADRTGTQQAGGTFSGGGFTASRRRRSDLQLHLARRDPGRAAGGELHAQLRRHRP